MLQRPGKAAATIRGSYLGEEAGALLILAACEISRLTQPDLCPGVVLAGTADPIRDRSLGARICNGLGIMRACLETATLERLEERLDELQGDVDQRGTPYGIATHHRAAVGPH